MHEVSSNRQTHINFLTDKIALWVYISRACLVKIVSSDARILYTIVYAMTLENRNSVPIMTWHLSKRDLMQGVDRSYHLCHCCTWSNIIALCIISRLFCRLNYRLTVACQDSIQEKCADACSSSSIEQPCGGTVLKCLTEKVEEITSEDCKKEVFYFQKMEVQDFRNDVILAETCRNDVDQYCAKVEAGKHFFHYIVVFSPQKFSLGTKSSIHQ